MSEKTYFKVQTFDHSPTTDEIKSALDDIATEQILCVPLQPGPKFAKHTVIYFTRQPGLNGFCEVNGDTSEASLL